MDEYTIRYNELMLIHEFNRLCTVFETPIDAVKFIRELANQKRLTGIDECINAILSQDRTFYPSRLELIQLYTKMKITPYKICNALHLNYTTYKAYLTKSKDVNIAPRKPMYAESIQQLLKVLKALKGKELDYGFPIRK